MNKKIEKKIHFIIFLLLVVCFTYFTVSFSNKEVIEVNSEPVAVMCSISDEYKEWEKLSDEEKANTIMPPLCDGNEDSIEPYFTDIEKELNEVSDVTSKLPSSYDASLEGKTNKTEWVKDQLSTGGCWAFATTTSLERLTQRRLNISNTYSTRHMEYANTRDFSDGTNETGYYRELGTGGNYYMVGSYLANGYGPIAESEMEFENNEDPISITQIQNKNAILDVNDILLNYDSKTGVCDPAEIEQIKQYVYENGSVVITTRLLHSDSNYYNYATNSFYYDDSSYPINHAVTIVGWDDNYAIDKFAITKPSKTGAWIVQNSYGSDWGSDGYYYISYEDVNVCDFVMGIKEIDTEIEDNAYIHDKLGYNSFLGFSQTLSDGSTALSTEGYAMNVFTKESGKAEIIREITFATNGTGKYTLYFTQGNAGGTKISNFKKIASGNIEHSGYMTYKLEEPLYLGDEVTDFSIAIHYDMDTSTKPIPVSSAKSEKYQYMTLDSGRSFISGDGKIWEDSTKLFSHITIASVKAFTDDLDYYLDFTNTKVSYAENIIVEIDTDSYNIDTNNLKYVVKDYNGKVVDIVKTENMLNSKMKLYKVKMNLASNLGNGDYTVDVYYNDEKLDSISFAIARQITSSVYTINQDENIVYVNSGVSIATFTSNLKDSSGLVKLNGTVVRSGILVTGMTIDSYVIVVKGDVTGDGYVKTNDVMMISKYTVEGTGLDSLYKKRAADVTGDGYIKTNDVMKISKYTVEGGSL